MLTLAGSTKAGAQGLGNRIPIWMRRSWTEWKASPCPGISVTANTASVPPVSLSAEVDASVPGPAPFAGNILPIVALTVICGTDNRTGVEGLVVRSRPGRDVPGHSLARCCPGMPLH